MLLTDQTAIITGGASGIGRATAIAVAEHGANVVIADIRDTPREGGEPTADRIKRETDSDAIFVECDVSDPADIDHVIDVATDTGGFDVFVNNAGVFQQGDPLETTVEEYEAIAEVNARGTFFGTQRAGKRLQHGDGGSIVNVASTSAFRADGSIAAYSVSKAAVVQTTRVFADALGPSDVRVNAVCPGAIDTALSRDRTDAERCALVESIPSRRIGKPVDVAKTIVFLASDLASYVNGAGIVVDGGLTV